MQLNELFQMNEWGGARSFGGYGQRIFTAAYYADIANTCHDLPTAIRPKVSEWFVKIFGMDNSSFKEDRFIKACEQGIYSRSNPRWQARHFYYLAECIKNAPTPQMKEYLAVFLADYFDAKDRGNDRPFIRKRWFDFCDITDPDAQD